MLKTPSKILVATDLSTHSDQTLQQAFVLAKATGAEVQIIYVSEPLSEEARVTMLMFVQDEAQRKKALNRRDEWANNAMKEQQDRLWAAIPKEDQGVRSQISSCEVVGGHPADVILREAENRGVDLIIMGAHEHGFGQTFLGSISKRVLRRTSIPTLIVPYTG